MLTIWVVCGQSYQNTPIFERLVAISQVEGTCSFLVFSSDCAVYVGSICLVIWKIQSSLGNDDAANTFDKLTMWLGCPAAALTVVCLVLSEFKRSTSTKEVDERFLNPVTEVDQNAAEHRLDDQDGAITVYNSLHDALSDESEAQSND